MSSWRERTEKVQVRDTVGYSKAFLQSTGQYTGDAPFARGKVTALLQITADTTLAEIDWDRDGLPPRANVKNLSTSKQIQQGE